MQHKEPMDSKIAKILENISDKMAPITQQHIQHFAENGHTISEMMLCCLSTMQWYIEHQIGKDDVMFSRINVMIKLMSGQILHWTVNAKLEENIDEDSTHSSILNRIKPSNN